MQIGWTTDIHLDMAGDVLGKIQKLSMDLRRCDALIITGDISVSDVVVPHLSMLETVIEKPIYFVLGNHDYYGSNIGTVRRNVTNLCNSSSYLRYMSSVPFIKLGEGKYLIGHDGWYDAQNGNPNGDSLLMNDWIRIADFNSALRASLMGRTLNKNTIIGISRQLAQQSVNHVANSIKSVIKNSDHIIVMTHVPPFKESFNASEKYSSIPSSEVLPWYTSKVMGDMLMNAARTYPHVKFTILSGHVHSHYDDDLLNNLNVKVGKSIYGNPQLLTSISV
jgi:predicted MPP superfamily phosphohydrolase